MNQQSQKSERFVSDGLSLLAEYDILKSHIIATNDLIKQFQSGIIVDSTEIFKHFDKASYSNAKIRDVVSSILMYSSVIEYETSDMNDLRHATTKNAYIHNITVSKNISIGSPVPAFSIDVTNLGFSGISPTDKLKVRLFNAGVGVNIEKIINVGQTSTSIMDVLKINIDGVESPTIPYEYTMEITLLSLNNVYAKAEVRGINVKEASSNATE